MAVISSLPAMLRRLARITDLDSLKEKDLDVCLTSLKHARPESQHGDSTGSRDQYVRKARAKVRRTMPQADEEDGPVTAPPPPPMHEPTPKADPLLQRNLRSPAPAAATATPTVADNSASGGEQSLEKLHKKVKQHLARKEEKDALLVLRDAGRIAMRNRRDDKNAAKTLWMLAGMLMDQDQHQEAEVYFAVALDSLKHAMRDEPEALFQCMHQACMNYMHLGKYDKAVPLLDECHKGLRFVVGCKEASADALHRLGVCMVKEGRLLEAEVTFKECLQYAKRDKDQNTQLEVIRHLCQLYYVNKRPAAAIPLLGDLLQLAEERLPSRLARTTLSVASECITLVGDMGDPQQAVRMLNNTLVLQRAALGADDPALLPTSTALGAMHLASGQAHKALAVLQSTWERALKVCPEDREQLRDVLDQYIKALKACRCHRKLHELALQAWMHDIVWLHEVEDKDEEEDLAWVLSLKSA